MMRTGANILNKTLNTQRTTRGILNIVGTRCWMAPEFSDAFRNAYPGRIFMAGFHPPGDWFALGAIAFTLLAGMNPMIGGRIMFISQIFPGKFSK